MERKLAGTWVIYDLVRLYRISAKLTGHPRFHSQKAKLQGCFEAFPATYLPRKPITDGFVDVKAI